MTTWTAIWPPKIQSRLPGRLPKKKVKREACISLFCFIFTPPSICCIFICSIHSCFFIYVYRYYGITYVSIAIFVYMYVRSSRKYVSLKSSVHHWCIIKSSHCNITQNPLNYCTSKLSVKRNLSLLQSDIQWNPLHQNDSYLVID